MRRTRIRRRLNAPRSLHGRFVTLVPNERVVQVVEFETRAPAIRGEMTITYALAAADGGTELLAVHDGLPLGLPAPDHETGGRSLLAKRAALVAAATPGSKRPLG